QHARAPQRPADIGGRARPPAGGGWPWGVRAAARVGGGVGPPRWAMVTDGYGRRASPAAAGSDGGSPPSTRYPAAVSRQTSQSGLMGLCTQGVAQPWATHDSMVFFDTSRPSRSNRGSFPPACVSRGSRWRRGASVGRMRVALCPDKTSPGGETWAPSLPCDARPMVSLPLTMIKDALTSSFLRYAKPIGEPNGGELSVRRVTAGCPRGFRRGSQG